MKLPVIQGLIERRILINYTADPVVVGKIIPAPFRPKLYQGQAIVGICLIRLKQMRPKGLPAFLGISSENGAHRIAVEWEDDDGKKEGVFVPRRDSSFYLMSLLGGRLFPGHFHYSKFKVSETSDSYEISFSNPDGNKVAVSARTSDSFPKDSIFTSLENASRFFESGSIGYSPNGRSFDGIELKTQQWKVEPLIVSSEVSSYFANHETFTPGTVRFDNALLMTNIDHEWITLHDIKPTEIKS